MPLGASSSGAKRTLFVAFFIGILLDFCFLVDGTYLWPMPKSVTHGSQSLYLGRDFRLTTDGSKYSDGSAILKDAFQRMINLVEASHTIDGLVPGSGVLAGVNVVVLSSDDQLNYGIDESYKLSVPTTGNPLYAHIEAQTVFGALHALQTFGQLCYFNFTTRVMELHLAPWTIFDQPRFSYRGLLIGELPSD